MTYWEFLGLVAGYGFSVGAVIVWGVRYLLQRHQQLIDERIERLMKQIEEGRSDTLALERSFMELKAALPKEYVRKEDYIRSEVVYNAKLDAIASKIDRLHERSTTAAGRT